MRVWKQG